jgi:hypothetical protein
MSSGGYMESNAGRGFRPPELSLGRSACTLHSGVLCSSRIYQRNFGNAFVSGHDALLPSNVRRNSTIVARSPAVLTYNDTGTTRSSTAYIPVFRSIYTQILRRSIGFFTPLVQMHCMHCALSAYILTLGIRFLCENISLREPLTT